jgi:hypothetical protein
MSEYEHDDEDYAAEMCVDRFRREHPTWTEEEVKEYFESRNPFTNQKK